MKNILNLFNKRTMIYTLIIWIFLNISGIHKMFFYGGDFFITIIVKVLHLIFLYIIVSKMYSLYNKKHIPRIKNEIIILLIYFLILTTLLLLVWPGTWGADDIEILVNASSLKLTPWQHFFSGLFHILCLQTIPIPSGVVIVQIILASLIVGYCISNISNLYGKNKKQVIILQIVLGLITLLPPLILYILSGFRMGMYSYLELLIITKMIILYKENKEISFLEILKISVITIIISCWRTEAIYYPFFILIMYLVLGKKVIKKKIAIISFLILMIINVSIIKINNDMIGNNNYSMAATTEPVSALVKNSNESDKEEIEAIDKVIDVEYILENPEKTGEFYFWRTGVVRKYTEEEYSNYIKAYLKLAIKYPDVAFKSMWNIFVRAGSGFGENSKQTTKNMVANTASETLELYNFSTKSATKWNTVPSLDLRLKKAINEDIRKIVISFFNGTDLDGNLTIIHNIFWNFFIPFILILICLIYKLVKKDWFMVLLICTVIARIPIVFATAPAEYFMYYLSTYLCTYIISAIVIVEVIINLKNKKKIRGLLCEKEY